jgi:hypothetical protein
VSIKISKRNHFFCIELNMLNCIPRLYKKCLPLVPRLINSPVSSSSFPFPRLSEVTTCFSSRCDKDSAITFTTGRLPQPSLKLEWVLTTANAAGTNGSTCLSRHGNPPCISNHKLAIFGVHNEQQKIQNDEWKLKIALYNFLYRQM